MSGLAAVTGMGCVTVAGAGAAAAREALLRGEVLGQCRDAGEMPAHWTARAPESTALEALLPGLGYPRPPRTVTLSLAAARECWRSGGGDDERIDHDRAGCAMSRNFGQYDVVTQYNHVLWEKGPASVSGLSFVQTIGNTVLGKVSLDLRLRGPSLMNFGAPVLGLALEALREGDADLMLAGGVDELSLYVLTRVVLGGLAAPCEQPSGPYDAEASGLLPGEAAAFLALETPESAQARGVEILGYLRGHASVTNGSPTSFERDPDDIVECIGRALEDAELAPADVTLVCGAGTRLPGFDERELVALERAFSEPPPLYSCKGALGETWGASAYLSAISVLQSLAAGTAPPTAGTTARGPDSKVPLVVGKPAPVRDGAALVLSLDLSGQDSAYLLTAEGR